MDYFTFHVRAPALTAIPRLILFLLVVRVVPQDAFFWSSPFAVAS